MTQPTTPQTHQQRVETANQAIANYNKVREDGDDLKTLAAAKTAIAALKAKYAD